MGREGQGVRVHFAKALSLAREHGYAIMPRRCVGFELHKG